MRLLGVLTIVAFLGILMSCVPSLLPAEEFRVWGGKTDDFTDSKGASGTVHSRRTKRGVDGLKNFPARLKSRP